MRKIEKINKYKNGYFYIRPTYTVLSDFMETILKTI